MTDTFTAFSISPVPAPSTDTVPPELFRGIYGMPMFVTVPTGDLENSERFWTEGLGFFSLFSVPGQIVHLRRWAFQDVLLVAGESADAPPAASVTFACILSQVEPIATACERIAPGSSSEPRSTPWNTVDVEVVTPENTRVVMTAARPYDPDSAEAGNIRDMGIPAPDSA